MKNQKELFENLNSLSTLPQIQDYISKVLELRGFSNQTVQDKLLLLIEEVGELAKSVRKFSSRASVDERKLSNYSNVESELADVFIVLVSVADKLNLDLFECLKQKESENINRVWKLNKWKFKLSVDKRLRL